MPVPKLLQQDATGFFSFLISLLATSAFFMLEKYDSELKHKWFYWNEFGKDTLVMNDEVVDELCWSFPL